MRTDPAAAQSRLRSLVVPAPAVREAEAPGDPTPARSGAVSATDGGLFAPSLPAPARFFKRVLDLVGATVLLVVSVPLLIIAVVAIRADSGGPAIFTQIRLGAGGRKFKLYKLRTMRRDSDDFIHQAYVQALIEGRAERSGGMFKLVSDPRVTRVGRWLRRLSIDELPQLWNVLRGDMSLVGPRPPLPRTWQRLGVKPGLTGLWQISGRCERTFDEMVVLDLRYVESWTPWLELKILLHTPAAVLSCRGVA